MMFKRCAENVRLGTSVNLNLETSPNNLRWTLFRLLPHSLPKRCCRSCNNSRKLVLPLSPLFSLPWDIHFGADGNRKKEREREAKQRLKESLKDKATQQWEMIWVGNYRI